MNRRHGWRAKGARARLGDGAGGVPCAKARLCPPVAWLVAPIDRLQPRRRLAPITALAAKHKIESGADFHEFPAALGAGVVGQCEMRSDSGTGFGARLRHRPSPGRAIFQNRHWSQRSMLSPPPSTPLISAPPRRGAPTRPDRGLAGRPARSAAGSAIPVAAPARSIRRPTPPSVRHIVPAIASVRQASPVQRQVQRTAR